MPIPATALGPVSVATVAWRARGVLYLTVVVKATFELVPEGRMRPIEPDPIAAGEEPDSSGVGLRTAGDLAPYLGQPEVWLTGHAAVPPRFSQPELRVQLALVQEGAVRIDKQVDLDVSGATGEPPRVRIAGMGPIAEDWPLRRRWLEGVDPRGLRGPVLDIPEALHWEYFQTAPLDQRLHALRGDDWLVLGGMVPRRPRFRTQLPEAWGAARLYRRPQALPRAGEPVALHADTIQIDVDRLRGSILFRGRVQLEGDAELGAVHVAAGLEQPGKQVAWADPFTAEEPREAAIPFGGTVGIPDDVAAKLAEMASTPFEQGRPLEGAQKPGADIPFVGTMAISDELEKKLAAALATPFEKPAAKAPSSSDIPFSGTMGLSEDLARMLAGAQATPFQAGPAIMKKDPGPPPPKQAEEPRIAPVFTGTMTLPDDIADKLAAASSTPFDRGAPASTESQLPFSGTLTLPDDLSKQLAAALATPFEARPEPPRGEPAPSWIVEERHVDIAPAPREMAPVAVVEAPPLLFATPAPAGVIAAPEEPGLLPDGLGAEFLAAIAEAGVLA